jgi:hypothetical protein
MLKNGRAMLVRAVVENAALVIGSEVEELESTSREEQSAATVNDSQ